MEQTSSIVWIVLLILYLLATLGLHRDYIWATLVSCSVASCPVSQFPNPLVVRQSLPRPHLLSHGLYFVEPEPQLYSRTIYTPLRTNWQELLRATYAKKSSISPSITATCSLSTDTAASSASSFASDLRA